MAIFFGALANTPRFLLGMGGEAIPAWQHSAVACLSNADNGTTRGSMVYKPFLNAHPLGGNLIKIIKREADRCGLHRNVFLPIPGLGKIGITAILEMWLEHVYPVPLTYGSYQAHGIELGSAVGAMHDKAHGIIDNRRFEVMAAIVKILQMIGRDGKDVMRFLPLATQAMVERYTAFNSVLRSYVRTKKANFTSRSQRDAAARAEYNGGIAPLFMLFHEKYSFRANVLEETTLEGAVAKLCANGSSIDDHAEREFDELGTLFNPKSDLVDEEIIAIVGRRPLPSVNIFPTLEAGVAAPVTIGDYFAKLGNWSVSRGRVYTEIRFNELATGKEVKVQVTTARYVFDSAQDHNKLLKLVGLEVPTPDIHFTRLAALEINHADRTAARDQVKTWITEIGARLNAMTARLKDELLSHVSGPIAEGYDHLVARQNAALT
jgi:hypothetical protein